MRANPFHELTAADAMRRGVVVPKEMPFRNATRLMAENRVGAAAVTGARGQCAGLLLATALARGLANGSRAELEPASVWSEWQMAVPEEGTADEVRRHMIPEPLTVAPDMPLDEAGRLALGDPSHCVVVVDGKHRPLGILSSADVLSAFLSTSRRLAGGDSMNGPLAADRIADSRDRDAIDVTSEDSFPASDPPSWTPIVGTGPPCRVGHRGGEDARAEAPAPARGARFQSPTG